jgi:predicted outer membrane lipoprotein
MNIIALISLVAAIGVITALWLRLVEALIAHVIRLLTTKMHRRR